MTGAAENSKLVPQVREMRLVTGRIVDAYPGSFEDRFHGGFRRKPDQVSSRLVPLRIRQNLSVAPEPAG